MSSPGSWPGCQFGREGKTSTVVKFVFDRDRVCLRFKIGEGVFERSGSERMDGAFWLPVLPEAAVADWPASRSKFT